jgi:hypothetical protein
MAEPAHTTRDPDVPRHQEPQRRSAVPHVSLVAAARALAFLKQPDRKRSAGIAGVNSSPTVASSGGPAVALADSKQLGVLIFRVNHCSSFVYSTDVEGPKGA